MSETPTGTDRVELTEDERERLWSVVAARVQALIAERDEALTRLKAIIELEPVAHAAEQVRVSDGSFSTDIAGVRLEKCDEYGRTQTTIALDAARAELERESQHHSETLDRLDSAVSERDALQATLDRVTALADEADRSERHINGYGYVLLRALRAALTPEGKP